MFVDDKLFSKVMRVELQENAGSLQISCVTTRSVRTVVIAMFLVHSHLFLKLIIVLICVFFRSVLPSRLTILFLLPYLQRIYFILIQNLIESNLGSFIDVLLRVLLNGPYKPDYTNRIRYFCIEIWFLLFFQYANCYKTCC